MRFVGKIKRDFLDHLVSVLKERRPALDTVRSYDFVQRLHDVHALAFLVYFRCEILCRSLTGGRFSAILK